MGDISAFESRANATFLKKPLDLATMQSAVYGIVHFVLKEKK